MKTFQLRQPQNPEEFEDYYDLRWQILRAPWDQPRGSEKDQWEELAEHVCAWSASDQILGVGRLHGINSEEAQVRYMAVSEESRGAGVGSAIYRHLEDLARKAGFKRIIVNARLPVTGFYEQLGFTITGDAHTLFNEIQHKLMEKTL